MQVMPSNIELMRTNMRLPAELRQSAVLLEFAQPVPRPLMSDFLLIHLHPVQLAAGEAQLYMPQMTQPDRVQPMRCRWCGTTCHRENLLDWRCYRPGCTMHDGRPTREIRQANPALRGVIRLIHAPEWLHHTETQAVSGTLVSVSVEYATAVALQLDRRYDVATLAAVGRTARQVAEERGWRLKG